MGEIATTEARAVLVAVDVQNDFVNGSLAVEGGEQVIAPLNTLASRVRASHLGHVAFTRDWHPRVTPHFDTWPVHCVADTEGAAFAPELNIEPGDTILSKGMGQTDGYSGIEGIADDGTTLEAMITPRAHEMVLVFIGGLATDYCVKATALDMRRRFANHNNVNVYTIRETMRGVNLTPDADITAIKEMAQAGIPTISLNQALAMTDIGRVEV